VRDLNNIGSALSISTTLPNACVSAAATLIRVTIGHPGRDINHHNLPRAALGPEYESRVVGRSDDDIEITIKQGDEPAASSYRLDKVRLRLIA
jgi:hypothetical protein